jgi:hypothetical protein
MYNTLFVPQLEDPIKTLDLPVAGRGYSADSVRLVFEFVNFVNGLRTNTGLNTLIPDQDGTQTLLYLQKVRRFATLITGTEPQSLGLHPAVYFYGTTGKYQPPAFLATVHLIQDLEHRKGLIRFTENRERFEKYLVKYRYLTNSVIQKFGSFERSIDPVFRLYGLILDGVYNKMDDNAIMASIQNDDKFKFVRTTVEETQHGKDFSTGGKSYAYIRTALQESPRCEICGALIHKNSISFDHVKAKSAGGTGDPRNARPVHPYCNSGYREHLNSLRKKSAKRAK